MALLASSSKKLLVSREFMPVHVGPGESKTQTPKKTGLSYIEPFLTTTTDRYTIYAGDRPHDNDTGTTVIEKLKLSETLGDTTFPPQYPCSCIFWCTIIHVLPNSLY